MAADVAPRPFTPQPSRPRPQPQQQQQQRPLSEDAGELTTLPDPRSRALSPVNGNGTGMNVSGAASPLHHPDLSDEVATLSTKLINAINHQTSLDDTLTSTKMELDQAHERIRQLEDQVTQQREMLAGDVWVRRSSVETEKTKLLGRVAEEKRLRLGAEEQKKKIEQELENLTAALFEEANKMVVTAKEEAQQEYEAQNKKNEQLRAQLADTEGLLRSQQDQLSELKHVMEQMSAERDDAPATTTGTAPSSPGIDGAEGAAAEDGSGADATTTGAGAAASGGSDGALAVSVLATEPLSPSYPTSFAHLVQPVLRTDITAYEDFRTLIRSSKRLSSNRVSTGSYHSGLSSLGLALGGGVSTPAAPASATPSNGSSSSLATAAATAAPNGAAPGSWPSPQTPGTPGSTFTASSSAMVAASVPALKDTRFYKRALAEDIEPTLRLDMAPGLSWLARRSVLNAMTDGSLVVEPVLAHHHHTKSATHSRANSTATHTRASSSISGRPPPQEQYPCSLCGESRRGPQQIRTHRFRTSESDSAQRYPLCGYCLARVRATGDFLGFLRIVRDGHWRTDDEDAERAAWEESVRLREQMFWCRIGGGVVPVVGSGGAHHHAVVGSPRSGSGGGATGAAEEKNLQASTEVAGAAEAQAGEAQAGGQDERVEAQQTQIPSADGADVASDGPNQRDSVQSFLSASSQDRKRLSLTIPAS